MCLEGFLLLVLKVHAIGAGLPGSPGFLALSELEEVAPDADDAWAVPFRHASSVKPIHAAMNGWAIRGGADTGARVRLATAIRLVKKSGRVLPP